jgi:pyridoxine 4-dehydrogenase
VIVIDYDGGRVGRITCVRELGVGAHAKPSAVLAEAAQRHRATPAQIGLAWLLARSPVMLPIPGTSRPAHLAENWSARTVHLEPEEVESIAAAARAD